MQSWMTFSERPCVRACSTGSVASMGAGFGSAKEQVGLMVGRRCRDPTGTIKAISGQLSPLARCVCLQ